MIRVTILCLSLAMPATAQDRPSEPVDPCTAIAQDDLRRTARVLNAPENQRSERELKREQTRLARSSDLAAMLRCLMNTRSERNSLGRTD
ncbi:hypothetical protein MUY35_09430 [Aliiroseovarius sp. S1339]|uniref:hypothetical protein n=1 Tax=Aliiroseovarius sp. S1339 TaxID=2936990 RepID=UPI0020C09A6A|nr:hypothetical protein [Aliiroseovarius sp. S1339]MCK8464070.1 hypothetical protein [Aliiroseovarius sp. S1339]